jgi:allantoin racemase
MRTIEEMDGLALGCAIESRFFRGLEEYLGVPVIDATIAPSKHAEFLVDLKRMYGRGCNRMVEYELTYEGEIEEWKPW